MIKSGQTILQINAVKRIAWHSNKPFYRALSLGDSGSDVRDLNALLRARKLSSQGGSRFTQLTRAGVIRLGMTLGAGNNVTTFSPGWVVYIPAGEVQVEKSEVVVGAVAPAEGTALFTMRPTILSGDFVSDTPDGDGASGGDLRALASETLTVGDVHLQTTSDGRAVAPSGLETIASLVTPNSKLLAATLTRTLPSGSVDIPASAIHTGADGANCVLVRHPNGEQLMARVTVISGASGQATVVGKITAEDQVGVGFVAAAYKCSS